MPSLPQPAARFRSESEPGAMGLVNPLLLLSHEDVPCLVLGSSFLNGKLGIAITLQTSVVSYCYRKQGDNARKKLTVTCSHIVDSEPGSAAFWVSHSRK